MPGSQNRHDTDKLRPALEKTVPAGEFSADATRRELERTPVAETPSPTPQQFLVRTESDCVDTPSPDDTAPIAGFSTTSLVPPELLDDDKAKQQPRFEVTGEAGRGGTAHVYRVVDRSLGRTIALKLLRTKARHKRGVKQRFIHEARVTALLEHPNIVPVYDIGVTDDDRVYFLMKNVTGVSVGDAIRAACEGEDVPAEFVAIDGRLRILLKVCDAIAFAHDKGYIHQDIKPDNLMLGLFGEVLVLDWGCALGEKQRSSGRIATYGTPAYMSPEQARQEGADERSDVYCLGATLYHMITLRHPTWSDDASEFWEMKRAGRLSPLPGDIRESVPGPLIDIAEKAMAPDPARRYRSVVEFQRALTDYQAHAESIALARRAAGQLEAAGEHGEYRDYTRITAWFEQALGMWDDNEEARTGLMRVRRIHALRALERGDLALAESIAGDDEELAGVRESVGHERERRRRARRRTRRTVYAAVALGVILLAGSGYYAIDYLRYFGKWQRVCHVDFTADEPDLIELLFSRWVLTREAEPAALGAEGLELPKNAMFWARDVRERGDVRVEVVATWRGDVNGLEIMLNTRREQVESFSMCPTGYCCQFGGWKGVINIISRNARPMFPDQGNAVGCDLKPGRTYRLWFQRVGETLSLHVDGREVFRVVEPLPLPGEGLEWVGVRSWADDIIITSFTVWRMGAPEKTSPLIAGDMFVQHGRLVEAAGVYLRIAQDHPGTVLEEQALTRAYLAASQAAQADSLRSAMRRVMRAKHPHSPYWQLLLEADCLAAWKGRRFKQAVALGSEALDRAPDSRIAPRMLSARPDDTPVWAIDSTLRLLSRTTGMYGLSLENAGVSDISPLEGLPIRTLALNDNNITDLSALRGMPLRMLSVCSNPVADLSPLRGMDIVRLEASACEIGDLRPLAGMPLTFLALSENRIGDIGALAGMPLEQLHLNGNRIETLEPLRSMESLRELVCDENPITDLGPLRGLSLNGLKFDRTPVSSLEPLAGMPLRHLQFEQTPVADLRPLRGMQLRRLLFSDAPVSSLAPLQGMPLVQLDMSGCGIADLAPLAGMPLEELNCSHNGIRDLSPLQGMPLEALHAQHNHIVDLTSLEGAPLERLLLKDNPLRSLAPFEHDPPKRFVFDSVAAGPGYAESVLSNWEREGDTLSARLCRAAIAFRRGDTNTLLELAVPFDGHRYLHVPAYQTFAQAREAARRLGGHLVTITSEPECQFVFSLLPERTGCWLGIDVSREPRTWVTGEPLTYTNFDTRVEGNGPLPKYMLNRFSTDGNWLEATHDGMGTDLLVEWER